MSTERFKILIDKSRKSNILKYGSIISIVDDGKRIIYGGVDENKSLSISSYIYTNSKWTKEDNTITFNNNNYSIFSLSADIEGKNLAVYYNDTIYFYKYMSKDLIIN